MSTNTYVALKTTTVTGSPAASVTLDLTGITGYTDLVVVVNGSISSTNSDIGWQFNSDTASNYSQTSLYGTGSAAASDRGSSTFVRLGRLSTSNSTSIINFQNYSNTTTYKTSLARGNAADALVITNVGLWRSTAAITSITATVASGANFTVGTTFTAYGIANADVGAYATGGIITQDANYYYHAFGSSSTFTPTRNLTADILVVAGGGGGGSWSGGAGGGAGGLLAYSSQSLTNGTGYSCTVGAGGAGSVTDGIGQRGSNGSNSQFASLTASVGGGGGGNGSDISVAYWTSGATGGSGGGGGGRTNIAGGSATSGQGYAGGNSTTSTTSGEAAGGGGGGAGSAGSSGGSSTAGGNGGAGVNTYSSWLSTSGLGVSGYIAGGGAGNGVGTGATNGTGGSGGGGSVGIAGVAFTGSGGGAGNGGGQTGKAGGSGLILIRYAK